MSKEKTYEGWKRRNKQEKEGRKTSQERQAQNKSEHKRHKGEAQEGASGRTTVVSFSTIATKLAAAGIVGLVPALIA